MNKRVQFSFFNLTKSAVLLAIFFAPELLAQGQSIVWAKSLQGRGTSTVENLEPGMSLAYDIAIDSQSHVIITGYSTDSVDFDPGTAELVLVTPARNPYLAKYDQNGELLWSHIFPSTWNLAAARLLSRGDLILLNLAYEPPLPRQRRHFCWKI